MWNEYMEAWEKAKAESVNTNDVTYAFQTGANTSVARAIDIINQAIDHTCKDMNSCDRMIVYAAIMQKVSNKKV